MLACRNDSFVGFPIVSREGRVVAVSLRDALPQLLGAFARTITDLEGDDLFVCRVNCDPDPLLVFFGTDETPQFIGLRLQAARVERRRALPRPGR